MRFICKTLASSSSSSAPSFQRKRHNNQSYVKSTSMNWCEWDNSHHQLSEVEVSRSILAWMLMKSAKLSLPSGFLCFLVKASRTLPFMLHTRFDADIYVHMKNPILAKFFSHQHSQQQLRTWRMEMNRTKQNLKRETASERATWKMAETRCSQTAGRFLVHFKFFILLVHIFRWREHQHRQRWEKKCVVIGKGNCYL